MTLVAIHQPTFLPWLGWWDKLARADVFVLLDDVQFPKKGGSWINRVRILSNGRPVWLTIPVDRAYHGVRTVREMLVDETKPWRSKLAATLAAGYGRAPYFDEVYPDVEAALHEPTARIAELNERTIRRLARRLDVSTHSLVRQSEVGVAGRGTELLVELCRSVDGDAYLTGDGADGYLVPELFARAGVELVAQRFVPPRYPQRSDAVVPGLSIVDALMSCGWSGTAELLASVRRT
jgi:hypothetical protein